MNIDELLKGIETPKVTREDIRKISEEVKKTDRNILRLEKEISELKAIKSIFEN